MLKLSPAGFLALVLLSAVFCSVLESGFAFSLERSDNLAVYWGQDAANHQQRLSFYCQDDTIDIIPLAFLYTFFGKGGMPVIDLSSTCGTWKGTFPGTDLADCSFLASDIKQCQNRGKLVTLSLGGAESKVGFTSDDQARSFAQTVWDTFLGGDSNTRPFGDAVLDGVDLDIESGSPAHYGTFVNEIRSLANGASKRYYITAAPQCPFPDAKVGAALNSAPFDAVFVQFYNNYCETSTPSEFNFDTWDKWARTQSANPGVKVYLGAPASSKAAGSGFVKSDTLISVARDAQNKYSSFGGIMLWDADTAYTNGRFDVAVKDAIRNGSSDPPAPSHTIAPPRPPPTTSKQGSMPKPTATPTTTTAVAETTISPVASIPDPRATARVKRPSYTLTLDNDFSRKRRSSRFFRF